jgi:hypothetical protein
MRFEREVLINKALAALDEAIEQCREEPIKPGAALRFALAFLYACSDGDRRGYDGFWRIVQDPHEKAWSKQMADYQRHTYAVTYRTVIARSVGAIP